jgi:hypothetical protein
VGGEGREEGEDYASDVWVRETEIVTDAGVDGVLEIGSE